MLEIFIDYGYVKSHNVNLLPWYTYLILYSGSIHIFHLVAVAVPLFICHIGEQMYLHAVKTLNILCSIWKCIMPFNYNRWWNENDWTYPRSCYQIWTSCTFKISQNLEWFTSAGFCSPAVLQWIDGEELLWHFNKTHLIFVTTIQLDCWNENQSEDHSRHMMLINVQSV